MNAALTLGGRAETPLFERPIQREEQEKKAKYDARGGGGSDRGGVMNKSWGSLRKSIIEVLVSSRSRREAARQQNVKCCEQAGGGQAPTVNKDLATKMKKIKW